MLQINIRIILSLLLFTVSSLCYANETLDKNKAGNNIDEIIGSWWDNHGNKYIFVKKDDATILPDNLEKVKKEIESGKVLESSTSANGIQVITTELPDGALEIITRYSGDKEIVQTRPAIRKKESIQTLGNQIKTLEDEINHLKNIRRYVWVNRDTDERVEQQSFVKLSSKFEYKGEQFEEEPNGLQSLTAKEKRLIELKKLKDYFLIDTSDPVQFLKLSQDKKAVKLLVTVENPQYRYQYPEAFYLNGYIIARRVLTNPKDISDVPINLIGQLLSQWSPPEWLILQVVKTGDVVNGLGGQIWRLHVTFQTGNAAILSLHTPFPKALILNKTPPIKRS